MLKRLTRRLVILSVLIVALTAVAAAPTQAEPTCLLCICENGKCECKPVICPD